MKPGPASGMPRRCSWRPRIEGTGLCKGDVMPTEADVAVVRRFYEALAAGGLAAAGKCFREDAIWHLPGTSRIAGTHRGWPAIRDDSWRS